MAVTSVTLNGTEINDGTNFVCGAPMLAALEAAAVKTPVMLEMQDAPPWFVRYQPKGRDIPLIVYPLATTVQLRLSAWSTLKAVFDTDVPITLSWTRDGVTKSYRVITSDAIIPDTYFNRVTGQLQALDPTPV